MSNWFPLQIILPFSKNMQDSITSISQIGLLHCCAVTFYPPATVALVLQYLKSCSQPAFTCMPGWEMSYHRLCNWPTTNDLKTKFPDSLNQWLWEYSEFSSTSGWTDRWVDQGSERNDFYAIARYVGLIYFAYGSWARVYEAFKGEVSCVFLPWKSQGIWNLWRHFGNANMDFSSYQGNVVWRKKKKHWTEEFQSKKKNSVRYRKCVYFTFSALFEFVTISIHCDQQKHQ